MKKLYSFIAVIFFTLYLNLSFAGIPPTFDMTVRNIQCIPGVSSDSIVQFELYLQQTNFGLSGVDEFEYCCAQFTWECNRSIQNGNLVFGLNYSPGANELPASLRPPAFQVDSVSAPSGKLYLKAAGNVPNNFENFFISPVFPGTKILTFRLRTSANAWPLEIFGLRFKLGSPPNTFVAYFEPYGNQDSEANPYQNVISLMDTVSNHYAIDYNGGYFICGFYPVEIMSFTSKVNKNNVTLNWTTAAETNNQGFEIERSSAGSENWSKTGYIPGSGTVTEPKNYSFSDKPNTGHYRYRLRQIDYNGSVNFHNLENEVVVGLPASYYISQNYPNPFNPSTRIDFELPYDSKVSISVYDISGREISKLINEQLPAGYHNVEVNGTDLSSGMYFYRIIATGKGQNFNSTKKMVLLK